MWSYEIASGQLSQNSVLAGFGYSGHEQGLNSVEHEQVANIGPVPRGTYSIGTFFDDPGGKGPVVAHLTPDAGTNDFGRSGFIIHGDNKAGDHSASHGCIILSRPLREAISASGDRTLEVI